MSTTKKTLMLEYGDWLFEEQSSIIYEKKNINEGLSDTLKDYGQATIAFIGALPPLEATGAAEAADTFNFFTYLARRQYVNAIFSLISVAPVVGDMIGKSGMVGNMLLRMRRGGGLTADVANWIARNSSRLLTSLRRLKTWVSNPANKNQLKNALRQAGRAYQQNVANRQTPTAVNEAAENETSDQTVDLGPMQVVYNFIINNAARLQRFFSNSSVVESLVRAVDQLSVIFDDLIEMIEQQTESKEESDSSSEVENKLTEHRLKTLAGIIE